MSEADGFFLAGQIHMMIVRRRAEEWERLLQNPDIDDGMRKLIKAIAEHRRRIEFIFGKA